MLKQWKWQDGVFMLMAALVCHFLFSAYGFNPTDEGFVLSATNRVWHGQIPHADFSSVRPLGYAYLHIPELLFSKDYFFLISRFVFWMEQWLIAYCWILLLSEKKPEPFTAFHRYLLTLVAFVFNVHYFPCAVLHTIDGLLLSLAGLLFIQRKKVGAGFLLLGMAALCKQNYLAVFIFAWFFYRTSIRYSHILAGFLPLAIYVGYVALQGGWQDMQTQLTAQHGLLQAGWLSYVTNPLLYAGAIIAYLALQWRLPKTMMAFALLLIAVFCLFTYHYHGKYMFLFFGALCGKIIYELLHKENAESSILALVISWSVSISIGYNAPSLFIGGILVLFILNAFKDIPIRQKAAANGVLLFTALIALYIVRTTRIYRDAPAAQLTYRLDGIVEGANGIYTNENTYTVLSELDSLKKAHKNLVVVPDFTATQISHSHLSYIGTEWPNKTEVPNEEVLQKVVKTIPVSGNDTIIIAIPMFQTALLAEGFTPLKEHGNDYPVIRYLRENFPKKEYSRYFELRSR